MTDISLDIFFVFDSPDPASWISKIESRLDRPSKSEVENERVPIISNENIRLDRSNIGLVFTTRGVERHEFPIERPVLSASVDITDIERAPTGDRMKPLFRILEEVYSAADPVYAFGIVSYRLETVGVEIPGTETPAPISEASLAADRIEHPTVLMLFPPAMVETYGREHLLSLPAERIEELDDGGLMILATDQFDEEAAVTEAIDAIDDALPEPT